MLSHIVPAAPHQVPPTKSQVIVTAIENRSAILNQKRQNQARRLPTTSASRSAALSTPKRLGQGIRRRKTRSAKPRKTITTASAARSETHQLQPFCCVNQTKSAGAVITATTVATRVRRRHERASSAEASPVGSVVSGTVVVIVEVYAAGAALHVQQGLSGSAPASVAP